MSLCWGNSDNVEKKPSKNRVSQGKPPRLFLGHISEDQTVVVHSGSWIIPNGEWSCCFYVESVIVISFKHVANLKKSRHNLYSLQNDGAATWWKRLAEAKLWHWVFAWNARHLARGCTALERHPDGYCWGAPGGNELRIPPISPVFFCEGVKNREVPKNSQLGLRFLLNFFNSNPQNPTNMLPFLILTPL